MSHTALYRKYRPQSFNEVLGQHSVVDVLSSAIKDSAISHAYLFSGSRGTGKTSVARIFASEIGTSGNDLYEIDAASNRGIDDIRALREAVQAIPFESKYKVYIIDEAHMLTKEAFNALLKTLEEPPEHAVFVLATTEMHKLPDTVISRCEVHHFKRPTDAILKGHVIEVAKREGYKVEKDAGELIALLGDGSFRDALGILQKVTSSIRSKDIKVEDVESSTSAPKRSIVQDVVSAIHKKDLEGALSALGKVTENGTDIKVFTSLLLQYIRYVLLIRYAPALEKNIQEEIGDDTFKFIKDMAGEKSSGINANILKELIVASGDVMGSAIPTLPLELALIRIIKDNSDE